MILSKDQINRYLRHIIIPEISGPGQKKLLNSKVILYASTVEEAAPIVYYLAATGIGNIYCHLKDKNGFDNLSSKVRDLNGDVVIEPADNKSVAEYKNNTENEGSLIKVLVSSYENLMDNLIDFTNNEFTPAILAVSNGWKGFVKTINNKDELDHLFSKSTALEFSSLKPSKEDVEGRLLSSCFLGTLTAIECIKLCSNIGTILETPLFFNLLSMEISKIENFENNKSIFDLLKDYFVQDALPLDVENTSNGKKLSESKVLVVGTGGLGSPVAYALSSLGVGTIGLVDYDDVEISNLNRQILHSTSKIGISKVESAKAFINDLAPQVNVVTYKTPLNVSNALDIINGYDIVVDAVDNFPARYLLNDSCYFADKPLVDAAAVRFHGLIMTILPKKGPCYRCNFPAASNKKGAMSCFEAGVLGPVPGVMGFLQAAEVIKLILGKGTSLSNRILYYDALDCDFDTISTENSADCDLCGEHATINTLVEYIINCENKNK